MSKNRITISKINQPGSTRSFTQVTPTAGSVDNIVGKTTLLNFCDFDNDTITTYVRIKEWLINRQEFISPPYVNCDYVD